MFCVGDSRVHTEPGKHGKYAIFTKSQGEPGIVREFLYNFFPNQGKVRENKVFSLHIISINYCHSCPQSLCSKCFQ